MIVNNGPTKFTSDHITMHWEPKPERTVTDLCIAYDPPGPTKASPSRARTIIMRYDIFSIKQIFLQSLAISMGLTNIESNTGITIYAYNKGQMTIPTRTDVYGSDTKTFLSSGCTLGCTSSSLRPNTNYEFKYRIIQDELVALDQPSRRCQEDSKDLDSVSQCIARYFEAKLNCSLYLLDGLNQRKVCDNNSLADQLIYEWDLESEREIYKKIASNFNDWEMKSELEIYQTTGCMPSCKRKQIRLETVHEITSWAENPIITLVFEYRDGMYNLNEEYLVYDYNNFIADIGGYLGLLLGHSIFSIYSMSADWITKPIRNIGNFLFPGSMKKKAEM